MATLIDIHPDNPPARLIERVLETITRGGIIVYPTDSGYALGCQIGNKTAIAKMRHIRELNPQHNFTLMCRDLTDIAAYAQVDNIIFRFLKAHTPGPYTFVLLATRAVPHWLAHPKRKTIGIRISAHRVIQTLLSVLEQPLISTTLILPGEVLPMSEIHEIQDRLKKQVDLIVNSGFCGVQPTTIVDLTSGLPEVIRQGKGNIDWT